MLALEPGAIEDSETGYSGKLSKPVPGRQPGNVVFADQTDELRIRLSPFQRFNCVERVGRGRSNELQFIEANPRLALDRGAEHFFSQVSRGRPCAQLVRRERRGNEQNAVELELLQGIAGQDEMPAMDGIEGAAEDADLFQSRIG